MRRNRIILLGLGLALVAALMPFRATTAQQGVRVNPAERLTERSIVALKDQLKNGLRATTPAQFAFINTVDAQVKAGQLPRAMVNLVYDWAIKRNPRVPFPYFQFALRALAKRRGINLP